MPPRWMLNAGGVIIPAWTRDFVALQKRANVSIMLNATNVGVDAGGLGQTGGTLTADSIVLFSPGGFNDFRVQCTFRWITKAGAQPSCGLILRVNATHTGDTPSEVDYYYIGLHNASGTAEARIRKIQAGSGFTTNLDSEAYEPPADEDIVLTVSLRGSTIEAHFDNATAGEVSLAAVDGDIPASGRVPGVCAGFRSGITDGTQFRVRSVSVNAL